MKIIRNLILIIALITSLQNVFAENLQIGKIEFSDEFDISRDLLLSIAELKTGEDYTEQKIQRAVQHLKNTTVFNPVTAETQKDKDNPNKIDVLFKMEKKWTLIPYIMVGSGGGSSYYAIGLFDSNFLNNLYTTNIIYKMENNEPNFSLTFINKYTLNLPLLTGISAQIENKKEIYYNPNNQINGYLSYQQNIFNIYEKWQFNDYFQLGGGILFQNYHSINADLNSSELSINQQNNIIAPNNFETFALQSRLSLGVINYDDLAEDGILLSSVLNTTANLYQGNNNGDDFTDIKNILIGFYKIDSLKNSYFAFRLGNLMTTSNNNYRKYFIGGLDIIRGFNYSQFFGKYVIFSNSEFRYTVWENNYIGLQLVPFFDAGTITNDINDILTQKLVSSYGFGIRLPLKKVNKIAIRLDYAETISPFHTNGLSFGLLQFF